MGLKNKLGKDKPWAILGITRKHYESTKPWKNAGMSRTDFDNLVRSAPPEMVTTLWDEAHADQLVEAMFGKDCKTD